MQVYIHLIIKHTIMTLLKQISISSNIFITNLAHHSHAMMISMIICMPHQKLTMPSPRVVIQGVNTNKATPPPENSHPEVNTNKTVPPYRNSHPKSLL